MIIQSLPAMVSIFIPASAPVITDIRIVDLGGGNVQVQAKVVG